MFYRIALFLAQDYKKLGAIIVSEDLFKVLIFSFQVGVCKARAANGVKNVRGDILNNKSKYNLFSKDVDSHIWTGDGETQSTDLKFIKVS